MRLLRVSRRSIARIGLILTAICIVAVAAPQKPSPRPAIERRSAKRIVPAGIASFADVSRAAGLDFHLTCGSLEKRFIMESMCGGIAVFDYDNDGWMDIFLVNGSTLEDMRACKCHPSKLYRNNHDGTFTDVTIKSGLGHCGWGFGAAVGDYDNDGWEDLYITYLDGAVLYHNNGDGTFTDVMEKLNIDSGNYYGLGVLWLDYDLDGCLDLYVANDSSPSLLYHNDCKGGFTEVGSEVGVAYSADGREQAGMGIDSADYDNDGWPDIVKTNFSDDANNLYHNDHNGQFTDMAGATGFGSVSIRFLAFGVKFLDFDNDGWKDIFVANGHVNPQVDKHSFGVTYAERPLLFHNLQGRKFDEIGMNAGSALARRYVARGAATGDFLNSGTEDFLITVLNGSPVLLRNRTQKRGHWLRIKTVSTRSNRDGFGARVELKAGGITQNAEVRANSSFESASDPRLHFGLGSATRVESIMVHWPSGKVDRLQGDAADQELVIEEGRGVIAKHPRRW